MIGYLHMKQPGTQQGADQLMQGLNDLREIMLIPRSDDEKKAEHGESLISALMGLGMLDIEALTELKS